MLHRATYDGGWQVIRSLDGGLHWQPLGPLFERGRQARALIDSIEGNLSPLRSGPDVSPRPTQSGAASSTPDLAG